MSDKLNLVVVEQNSTGGLIHYAYQLCAALAELSIDVTLITGTNYELKEFPHNFRVENRLRLWTLIDPHSQEDPPKSKLLRWWRKLKWTLRRGIRAIKLIREWLLLTIYLTKLKPDIVQFGKINFPFEAIFLAWMRRKGLTLTQICHEFERRESQGRFAAIIDQTYAAIYKNFSYIFFHAQENRTSFFELFDYPEANTHIIPHGNENMFLKAAQSIGRSERDLRQQYDLEDDDQVVLFFGTLSPSKGIPDLLNAFAFVREHCAARLLIAGYPSKYVDVDEFYSQVEDLNLSERVIFDFRYIPIEEVGALFTMATLVVYPYRSSTQSGSLQVAYAFGRPIIATRVGGLPEAVEDGKNGFLVPVGDSQKMGEKIVALINNPALSKKMGKYAKHLSETKFGWTPIARQIEEKYRHLLANGE